MSQSVVTELSLLLRSGWRIVALETFEEDRALRILERASKFKLLATNELDDRFDASPALAGNQLFLRGAKYLYCIEAD